MSHNYEGPLYAPHPDLINMDTQPYPDEMFDEAERRELANVWSLTVDEGGLLQLPEDLIDATGWTPDTFLQWSVREDGAAEVRPCEEVDSENFIENFDEYFSRVEGGETFVIIYHDQKLLFAPITPLISKMLDGGS